MLDKQRKVIDKLDVQLVELLNKRADAAIKIGRIKSKKNGEFYKPEREKEILSNITKRSKGPMAPESIKDIYSEILNGCRMLQKTLKIAYFGPEATYTHQAAIKNFGRSADYINCQTIPDVFNEVEKQRADYGVVPIENSTEGMVNHTLDMFKNSVLKIVMEMNLPIHHYLLSKSSSIRAIRTLYYFPQAYGQCYGWIRKNLKNADLKESLSTAESAKSCKAEKNACAIASKVAAKMYGLNVLAGPIEDYRQNVTRFLVIGNQLTKKSTDDKTSIMFSIKDRMGALHDMLIPFKRNRINLTKIESRPTKAKAWNYIFYVDFVGHVDDSHVKKALRQLEGQCSFLKVLGSYPRGD